MQSLLPAAVYSHEETFAREQSKFRELWQFAGFTQFLRNHNDFITREIGGHSVVVQNFSGQLHAFQNVCSHRFSRIQTAACGNRALQCPYHGWTYNDDGIPSGIPKRPRFDDLTPETCQALRLKRWRVETCGGLVFVTANPKFETLRDYLGEAYDTVARMTAALGELADTNELTIEANWKILIENTLESYHVNFVHHDTFRRLGVADGVFEWQGPHSSWSTGVSVDLAKAMERPLRTLKTRPFSIDGYFHQLLFPNLTLATTFGTTIAVQLFEPLSATRTRFTSFVFATSLPDSNEAQKAILNTLTMSATDFNRRVFEEDRVVCEYVQLGTAETTQGGMLSDEEARVGAFQRAYLGHFSSAAPYARRVVIVGAGDFGRELHGWLKENAEFHKYVAQVVFVNDDPHALDKFPELKDRIISTIGDYLPLPGDDVFVAIGNPAAKLKIAQLLHERGASFGTFIHRSAMVEPTAVLGMGCVICPQAVVSCRATLGDFVALNIAASVGHDVTVGTACTLSAHADVTGHVTLGTGVFLGSHAVVLPKVKVGEFATIAAGSVALRNVKARTTVIGVPAKRIELPAMPAPEKPPVNDASDAR